MSSSEFNSLQEYLRDPAKAETKRMWQGVTSSALGPDDRQRASQMEPVVKAYLAGSIDRGEYERQMAALQIPSV